MSGFKRSFLEQLTLFILFIIALPFILIGAVLFISIYLITAPIEWMFYKSSFYYKELKEKYYLTITFNKNYKIYNKLRKTLKYNQKEKYYEDLNNILIIYNEENQVLNILNNTKNTKKIYIVINKNNVNESTFNEIKNKVYIILYED